MITILQEDDILELSTRLTVQTFQSLKRKFNQRDADFHDFNGHIKLVPHCRFIAVVMMTAMHPQCGHQRKSVSNRVTSSAYRANQSPEKFHLHSAADALTATQTTALLDDLCGSGEGAVADDSEWVRGQRAARLSLSAVTAMHPRTRRPGLEVRLFIIIIIIIIYLPGVCNISNNNREQTVGQDSKATQDAPITAHKNYATQKRHNILTNTSKLNKIHPVYLPNKT